MLVSATGDLDASAQRLSAELRRLRYPAAFDLAGARVGHVHSLLPALHHALLFSKPLALHFLQRGYELNSKTDARFVEVVWKLCRQEFGYRPSLSSAQFLVDNAFAEQKIVAVTTVALHCKKLHNSLLRQERVLTSSSQPQRLHTAQRAEEHVVTRPRLESAHVEAVPAHKIDSRVVRATQTFTVQASVASPSDAASLQSRLADAERIIAAQVAAISRLESRLQSVEISSRPQSRAESAHTRAPPARAEAEDLASFLARIDLNNRQTQRIIDVL